MSLWYKQLNTLVYFTYANTGYTVFYFVIKNRKQIDIGMVGMEQER